MWQALVNIAQAAPHRSEDLASLLDLRGRIEPHIGLLAADNASYGLVHGDAIPSNILSQTSELALLDFDLCAYGWRVYDVASFLVEIAWWDMGDDVRDAFMSGYNVIRPLSQEELESLPAVQATRCLLSMGLAARHVNTWGRIYFSDASIDKSLTLIRDVFPSHASPQF